jgi:hypothetical protein
MIAELKAIVGALEMFRIEHGRHASSLDELTNYVHRGMFDCRLVTTGPQWSIAVRPQGILPGYYLLTSESRLHFDPDRPATTNDLDLWSLR